MNGVDDGVGTLVEVDAFLIRGDMDVAKEFSIRLILSLLFRQNKG